MYAEVNDEEDVAVRVHAVFGINLWGSILWPLS